MSDLIAVKTYPNVRGSEFENEPSIIQTALYGAGSNKREDYLHATLNPLGGGNQLNVKCRICVDCVVVNGSAVGSGDIRTRLEKATVCR
jgi:hypothetical protein